MVNEAAPTLRPQGCVLPWAVVLLGMASSAVAEPICIAEKECELTVTGITSNTVRITLAPPGQRVVSDDVLVNREWPSPALEITRLRAERTVPLKALSVTVRPEPLSIDIDTAEGETVQRLVIDETSGAVRFRTGEGHLFGLGSGGKQFDRRGAFYPMAPTSQPPDKATRGFRLPLPFLLSIDGWGMFVHRPYRTSIDLRGNRGLCAPPKEEPLPLDLFVICAEDPQVLMREHAELTGYPVMPPRWALGYFQSHRTLAGPDEVLDVAETFRRKRLPCDGLIYLGTGYCPTGWNTGHGSFKFNPRTFDKPGEMIERLHEQHFHVVLHVTYPPKGLHGQIPPAPGTEPDDDHILSYWAKHQPAMKLGVDGWWPDTGQYLSVAARLARCRMYYQGALAEGPGIRPFTVFENAGYSGMQRYGGWTRTGDTTSLWKTLKEQVPVIVNASLSGIPYYGSCTGGFWPDPELTGELYTRWFQFSAFTPFFQSHGRTWHTRLPWGWNTGRLGPKEGRKGREPKTSELHNPEVEPICREYLALRYQLIPYLYTLSREAYDSGMPILRAMWLHYPDDPRAIGRGDQYLWGPSILVAPVARKGAERRTVYLPRGTWYDFWTNKKISGGQHITRSVDLETLPLYVPAGAILPFDPVRQYTGQPVEAPTTIRIYRGADGQFPLYEDDGISMAYLDDNNAIWTTFRWNDAKGRLTIEPDPRSTARPAERGYRLRLLPAGHTKSVKYKGEAIKTCFDN